VVYYSLCDLSLPSYLFERLIIEPDQKAPSLDLTIPLLLRLSFESSSFSLFVGPIAICWRVLLVFSSRRVLRFYDINPLSKAACLLVIAYYRGAGSKARLAS
jgi:hypothetical protein